MTSTISKRALIYVIVLFMLSGSLALPSFAQTPSPSPGGSSPADPGGSNAADPGGSSLSDPGGSNSVTSNGTLVNPLKVNSLTDLLALVLDAAKKLGTVVLILALVWTGFLFVAARGNEEKLRTARTAFFWTIIGGLILLGATGLSAVIQSTATNITN